MLSGRLLRYFGFTLFVCLLVVAPAVMADDKLIKLAHPNRNDPFDNGTAAMAVVFKSLVETGSAGRIKVDIYPAGQLGKDSEALKLVQNGVIQSAISASGGIGSIYPLIGVLDLPFAFPSIASTYRVLDGPFGQRLAADMASKTGMHVLGFGDSGGFFAITNSKHPIKSPADMTGLKFRTMGLETHNVIIRSLGGSPVSIPFTELQMALQTGMADGQINPVPVIRFAQLDQLQKYLTVTNLVFAPYGWVMNQGFWDSLTPEEKAIVTDAAQAAVVADRGLNRLVEASEKGLPALKQRIDVYVPTAAEDAAFAAASQAAVKSYIQQKFGEEGTELMKQLTDAIDKNGS